MLSSKRPTLLKEVAEIPNIKKEDNIILFINEEKIVIRNVLPEQGKIIRENMAEFNNWARMRQCEIDLMKD